MCTEAIEIRPFDPADAEAVSALVRQVFDEHVAPTFEPEGIAEFHAFIDADALVERIKTTRAFVAWQYVLSGSWKPALSLAEGDPAKGGPQAVGVIEVKETDHVSLLFVRTSHMGLGIATALIARAVDACRAAGRPKMTVNSSLNAQTFYKRMGFVPADEPQKVHGVIFVPMEKTL